MKWYGFVLRLLNGDRNSSSKELYPLPMCRKRRKLGHIAL
jgi:hypothetical protein